MRLFRWSEAHATDVPGLDAEHQALFQLCDDLDRAIKTGMSSTRVLAILHDLTLHAIEHFCHEERQMRACGYALYGWHKRQHDTARGKLRAAERRTRRGDGDAAGEAIAFLNRWLGDHVRLADRMLVAAIRNQRLGSR